MKKIELLSPVGDFECLKAAVQNGADSVYFGAANFNARASATNFDLTNLKDAIAYANLRGVKTHLTLNTLIKNNEFEDAVLLAEKAYEFGIDAIIVQDLGLATTLIKNFPDLPIHASTQMTIHNLEGALEAEKLGFKRVVLSRELSLDEIRYICSNCNIEIETFIHGALCISYSGQCLFSSMIGGRSGNRGRCAQPCRLPYQIETLDNSSSSVSDFKWNISPNQTTPEYLLSTRDLCGLEYIPALIDAGVMCFKIEGRMKTPEYVATVTRIYRKYIDLALSNNPYIIDEKDKKDLMQVFNRGGFSCGHLSNEPNTDLVYSKKQNNMGIYIGNVSNINANKGHVLFSLTDSISIGDIIQFEKESTKYTVSELMIKNKNYTTLEKKDLVEIGRMKGNIHAGDKIFKIVSKELSSFAELSYSKENKKVKLSASITVHQNEPIEIIVNTANSENELFNNITISKKTDIIPVEANSKPIDEQRIISQLSKTNDTIFEFEDINVSLEENTFIPSISALNELRRNCLEEILNIANSKIYRKGKNVKLDFNQTTLLNSEKREISVLLNILDNSKDYTKLKNINNIYIPLKYFNDKNFEKTISTLSNSFNLYIYLPSIIKTNYKNILMHIIEKTINTYNIKGFVISNISGYIFMDLINKYGKDYEYIANYTLNVFNNYTEGILKQLGVDKITISPELDSSTIRSINSSKSTKNELIVYGNTPLMTTNYCLLGHTNKCYPTCGTKCKNENVKYYLKDRLGFNFRFIPDNIQTVTTIYNSKTTSINGSDFDVNSYRIDILDENLDEINNIVQTALSGNRLEGKDYTNGNLNREI